MPFLFHAQKKSIFDIQDKIKELSQFQVKRIQQIQQKKLRSPEAYSINVQICKDHPFRKINKEKINQLQQDSNQNTELFLLQKQKIMLKYTNTKAQKSKQRFLNFINQLQSNQQKNSKEESLNICIKNTNNSNDSSAQQHKNLNKFNSLKQFNLRKVKFLNNNSPNKISHIKKQRLIFQVKQTPGPGQYKNIIKQGVNHKSLVLYKSKQERKKQITNEQENKIQKVKILQLKKPQTSQTKTSINEKKHSKSPKLQPKNKKLIDLILSKSKKQTQQILCDDEQQYQRIESCQPSPDKYNVKSQFCKKTYNQSNIFISEAERLPAIKNSFSATQYLKQPEIQMQQKKDNIGFLNSSARQLHFDTQELCKQQFYYSPKNNLIDSVKQKSKFRTKNYFGSSLQRFQNNDQNIEDSYKYAVFNVRSKYINPGVCFKFTQKRQLFKDMINHDFVGPKYNPINGTIEEKVQKQVFRILLKSKFKDEVISMKKKKQQLEEQLKNMKKNEKIITSSKPIEKQQEKNEIKEIQKKQKKNICFGQNAETQNQRGFKPKQEFDGYYQNQPNWNIPSFNKNYQYY